MTRAETIRFLLLRSLGNFLLLLSLYGVFMTFGPALTEEFKYRLIQIRGINISVADAFGSDEKSNVPVDAVSQMFDEEAAPSPSQTTDTTLGFAEVLAGNDQHLLRPPDPSFSIIIPKLGASAKVFPNVDPGNKDSYLPILKQGVAHASGTSFPGLKGTTYLFAHSADNWWDVGRYNAIFYTLHNLSAKDEIIVFFENRRYTYEVTGKIIADPQEVSYLLSDQEGESRLVLQTCWPPGTTWKRLFVVATPKNSE